MISSLNFYSKRSSKALLLKINQIITKEFKELKSQ